MKKRLGWTLLAWYYVAYGMGGPYPPQLFGPFISEEQCVAQANDWSARGVPRSVSSRKSRAAELWRRHRLPSAPARGPAGAPVATPPGKTPLMAPNQPMKK